MKRKNLEKGRKEKKVGGGGKGGGDPNGTVFSGWFLDVWGGRSRLRGGVKVPRGKAKKWRDGARGGKNTEKVERGESYGTEKTNQNLQFMEEKTKKRADRAILSKKNFL